MLLVIHNLPANITYNEIKDFLRNKCGLDEFILDNLETENSRSKRITVGLAEESDAAILVRKVNGMYLKGQQLFIENMRQKKSSEQPYNSYIAQQENMKSSNYNYSAQNNAAKTIPNAPIPSLMNPYQMVFGNMQYMPLLQAPAVASEHGQQQWSTDPGAYQNNAPFYQQQSYQTPEMQQVQTPVFLSETKQVSKTNVQIKNKNETQFQNVAYPDRARTRTVENTRDRYNTQTQERGVTDNQNRGYRDSALNCDRDGNRDRGLNRGDRIVKFVNRDRDSTNNINVNREQEPNSSGTARESRWDVHVRNTREWASNDNSATVHSKEVPTWKNEKNQPSPKTQFGDRSFHDRSVNSRSEAQFRPPAPSTSYNRSQFAQTLRTNYNPKEINLPFVKAADVYKKYNSMKRKHTPDESKSSSQGCKLPERNLHMAQNALSALNAPPEKKVKPNEIDPIIIDKTAPPKMAYSRRIKKHKTWVCQVAANIGKEVLKSSGIKELDAVAEKVLVQLKKCIQARLDRIYGYTMANSYNEVLDKYTKKFKYEQYCVLYKNIREEVENNIQLSISTKAENKNKTETKSKPKKIIPPSRHFNPYKTVSQNTPYQKRPGPQMEKSSRNKPAAISEFLKVPQLPESLPANMKLPTYPLGDKQVYKQQKKINKLGLQEGVLEGQDKLALDKEMKTLQEMFILGCKEIDKQLNSSHQTRWEPALYDFTKTLNTFVTNRILNIRTNLSLIVFFSPNKPLREDLETFLKKYDVISLKKSVKKKFFVATCGTFKGYDALVKLEHIKMGDIKVCFKPLHLIGIPKKYNRKRKPGEQQSSSDDSDDEEDKINKEIADCHRELLNDTDVELLEEVPDVINLDDTNDDIKSDDGQDFGDVKDHDKNIDTDDEISQNDIKFDDDSKVTVDSADTNNKETGDNADTNTKATADITDTNKVTTDSADTSNKVTANSTDTNNKVTANSTETNNKATADITDTKKVPTDSADTSNKVTANSTDTNNKVTANSTDTNNKVIADSTDTNNKATQNDDECNKGDKVTTENAQTEVTQHENKYNTMCKEATEKRNSPALVVGDNSYLVLDDVDNDDEHNDQQIDENLQDFLTTDITEDDLEDF